MKTVKAKAISSLKKVMLTDNFYELESVGTLKVAKGERVSFQIALKNTTARKMYTYFKVCDEFKKFTRLAKVDYTPVRLTAYPDADSNYLSHEPGLFPDVLYPIDENSRVVADINNTVCVWFTIDLPKTIKAGKHTISVEITNDKDTEPTVISIDLEVKKTVINPTDLIYTQWFHCDCIADYFGVPMMSKKHWTYIENFIKTAARTGINMLLTPIFTPPLDTDIGGERPTMQLVKVAKNGDKYSFDFTLFDKWVKICHKHGIKYFEISHLFTQWGASFCPKIIVNVDGRDEMLFGWHVESTSKEYIDLVKENQTDKDNNIILLYVDDPVEKHPFVEAAKNKGYDVLEMNGQLDSHYINWYEQKNENTRFVRVDSDIIDHLIRKKEEQKISLSEAQQEIMRPVFESQMPDDEKIHYHVSFEAMSADAAPVVITQNEFMRRMKEMAATSGGDMSRFYGEMPDNFTITVNGNHPIVLDILGEVENSYGDKLRTIGKKITAAEQEESRFEETVKGKKEDELTAEEKAMRTELSEKVVRLTDERNTRLHEIGKNNALVRQIIDLALLSNGMLKGKNLTDFIQRSISLIEK